MDVPQVLCLEKSPTETLEFIDHVRLRMFEQFERGSRDYVKRRPGKLPLLYGYASFSNVEFISTAAALMLASEYDRIRSRMDKVPPAVNLSEWSPAAFNPLFEIGFFDLIGISSDAGIKIVERIDVKTMKIVAMPIDDGNIGIIVDQYIRELYEFVFPGQAVPEEISLKVLTALSEAMSNVVDHAYPEDFNYPVPPIRKLWVTASASKRDNSLTVVVYDQGAGIPYTYPRKALKGRITDQLKQFLLDNWGNEEVDGHSHDAYIEMAMRFGHSRTDKPYRGKGLPQMNELITSVGGGRMSIYSGQGWWSGSKLHGVKKGLLERSVGGTLIEWNVHLDKGQM